MIHYVRKSSCRKTPSHVYVTGFVKDIGWCNLVLVTAIDSTFNFLNSYYLRIFDKYLKKKYSFDLRKKHIFLYILSEMKDLKCIKYIEMRKSPLFREITSFPRITRLFTEFLLSSLNQQICTSHRYVYHIDI